MRILAIDDSKAVHAFIKVALNLPGVELVQAFDGAQGFETFQKLSSPVDLILLDWEMPVQDGPTTLAALLAVGAKCPVVMMTTRNSPDDIALMLSRGASEYMLKPFTTDILLEKIETILACELPRVA